MLDPEYFLGRTFDAGDAEQTALWADFFGLDWLSSRCDKAIAREVTYQETLTVETTSNLFNHLFIESSGEGSLRSLHNAIRIKIN